LPALKMEAAALMAAEFSTVMRKKVQNKS